MAASNTFTITVRCRWPWMAAVAVRLSRPPLSRYRLARWLLRRWVPLMRIDWRIGSGEWRRLAILEIVSGEDAP